MSRSAPERNATIEASAQLHAPAVHVYEDDRYDGKTLTELIPTVVAQIARAVDPVEIILFGSVARGDDGPDSDIDLLVVFDHVDPADKRSLTTTIYRAIRTFFAPVDILVTDPAEMARRRDNVGSILYWPLREGRTVYQRPGSGA